jgi:hypothetical protein
MNTTIIHKQNVRNSVLDELATVLPAIIAETLEVPGGHLALVRPEQVALEFTQASPRDVGSDIRILIFARSNNPRTSSENDRAKAIHDRVLALIASFGDEYSVNIRLYLMEIGAAGHALG